MLKSSMVKYAFMTTNAALLATVAWVGNTASILIFVAATLLGVGWGWAYRTEVAEKRVEGLLKSLHLLVTTEAAKAENASEQGHGVSGVDSGEGRSDSTKH